MKPKINRRAPLNERFGLRIEVSASGCWLWTGKKTDKGYGAIRNNKKTLAAHRVSYELHCGPIPDGKEIDHLCRVRHCVNPAHLEPVIHHVNVLRGEAGKRQASLTHCKQGHPFDKSNTTIRPDGSRGCRICRREAGKRYASRNIEKLREKCRNYYQRTKAS